jgi:hypothetical protein
LSTWDDTAVRAIEAAHEVEHRALPGSIRSDDARDIARARIEAEIVYRADSTEVHGQVACTKAASGAGGQVSHHIPPLCCHWAPPTFLDQVCCQSHEAIGRQPQHQQQDEPDEEQTILSKKRKDLRQQHNDQCSNQRAEEPVGAANHHHEQKEDRLKEGKGFRADEVGH